MNKKSKYDPIFTLSNEPGIVDGTWNTAGLILTNIRMYSSEGKGKTKDRLLNDIYSPPADEYDFEAMVKKGYVFVQDDKYYITIKGSNAIAEASGFKPKKTRTP